MTIIVSILHTVFILAIAYLLIRTDSGERRLFWTAFAARMFCGLSIGWLYMEYYGYGDTLVFFHDAKVLSAIAKTDFVLYLQTILTERSTGLDGFALVDPRSLFFVGLISPLAILTLENYWLMAAYCSLISFSSAWYLYRTIRKFIPSLESAAAIALLFFPSIVFWSSGLIKESVACACLFLLTAEFLKFWFAKSNSFIGVILSLAAIWILWSLKYYYAAVFLPVGISLLTFRLLIEKRIEAPWKRVLTWLLIFGVMLAIGSQLHPNFHPDYFIDVIVSNYEVYQQYSKGEGVIVYHSFTSDVSSLLFNSPVAIFSALYRPFLFEASNTFQVFAAFENLLLLVLTVSTIVHVIRKRPDIAMNYMLLTGTLLYVLLLADFLALSTPNYGTLSRYKVGFLPFFVIVILSVNPMMRWLERRIPDLAPY